MSKGNIIEEIEITIEELYDDFWDRYCLLEGLLDLTFYSCDELRKCSRCRGNNLDNILLELGGYE